MKRPKVGSPRWHKWADEMEARIKEVEQDRNEWKCSQQAYKAEAEELREFKRKIEIERITALASLPPEELARRIDKAIDELLEAGNE